MPKPPLFNFDLDEANQDCCSWFVTDALEENVRCAGATWPDSSAAEACEGALLTCRTLRSTKMTGDASEEAVPEIKYVRTSNSAEDHSGWVLSKQE
ncbi:hypothetical protein Gotri_018208 [Gossypium trilobum]|uniref:Uncharacterized protein n=2 Tax=Gossypium TaxID=3633 RepID=A0A7J9E8X8_9ROSI|nr:hypothetical protein [Gossypium trilobum]